MLHLLSRAKCALAVSAIMASPFVLVTLLPPLIKLFDPNSAKLIALAMWGPIGIALLRRAMRLAPARPAALDHTAA